MAAKHLIPAILATATLAYCTKAAQTSKRAGPASPTTSETVETGSIDTGNASLSGDMSQAIAAALTEGGIDAAKVQAISRDVQATGVIAVVASALHLSESAQDLAVVAPAVTGAFIASLDAAGAGLTESERQAAAAIIVSGAFGFVGEQIIAEGDQRIAVLGDMAKEAVKAVSQASLSDDGAVATIGAVAGQTVKALPAAGVAEAQLGAGAGAVAAKIGAGFTATGLPDAALSDAVALASEKAGAALGDLGVTDPVAAASATTEGFVSGVVATEGLAPALRLALASRIPEGVTAAFTGWLPMTQWRDAMSAVTNAGFGAMLDKAPEGSAVQDFVSDMAGAGVKGLARGRVSASDVHSQNLATAPFESIANALGGAKAQALSADIRMGILGNALSSSLAALGKDATGAMVDAVAPGLVTGAFAAATAARQHVGLHASSDQNMQKFFGGMFEGTFKGMSSLSGSNKTALAAALPGVVSKAMSAAATSASDIYGDQAINTSTMSAIPALAMQSMGEKLAPVLPPTDMTMAFGAATSQYLASSQTMMSTKAPSADFAMLSKQISSQALASFSGSFNGNAADIQAAATALSGRLGTFSGNFDSKTIAAIQGAATDLVVATSQTHNGGSLPSCAVDVSDTMSDLDFESALRQHPELVACQTTTVCPTTRTSTTAVYRWNLDPFGDKCFLVREPKVALTGTAPICPAGASFVYGIGCRPDFVACAADQQFVYGVGCQTKAYFCPVGQIFVAGSGCQTDPHSASCPAGQRYVAGKGCEASTVTTCAVGSQFVQGQGCINNVSQVICPVGTQFVPEMGCTRDVAAAGTTTCMLGAVKNADGLCVTVGACASGTHWDHAATRCVADGQCSAGLTWNAVANACIVLTAANSCPAGQFFSALQGSCVTEGMCVQGSYWDAVVKTCRANGTCSAGNIWNPDTTACEPPPPPCAACTGTPAAPTALSLVEGAGSLHLSWAASSAAGYVLLRRAGSAITIAPQDGRNYGINEDILGAKVAAMGPFTTYVDNNVVPGTAYHYKLFAVNFTPTGPVYSSTGVPASGTPATAPSGAPTVPPTLTFTSLPGAISLSWDSSNASKYILFRSRDAAVAFVPAIGIHYAPGQTVGMDTQVVFKAPGVTFADNQVSSDHIWHYALYAVNETASGPEYSPTARTVSGAPSAAGAPSTPTGLEATGISGGISLSWDDMGVAGYLVIRRIGAAVADHPTDNVHYNPGAWLGSGQVVFKGTGRVVSDTLGGGTTVHYAVYAYNSNAQGPQYSAGAFDSATPLAGGTHPAPVTGFASTDTKPVNLSWTAPNASGYVLFKSFTAIPAGLALDGIVYPNGSTHYNATVVYNGPNKSFMDAAVDAGDTVYYRIFAYNSSDNGPLYSDDTPVTQTANVPNLVTPLFVKNDVNVSTILDLAYHAGYLYAAGQRNGGASGMDGFVRKIDPASPASAQGAWDTLSITSAGDNPDGVNGLAVDSTGNVWVAGGLFASGQNKNFMMRRFSPAGAQTCADTVDGGANGIDEAIAIATVDNKAYLVGTKKESAGDPKVWIRGYAADCSPITSPTPIDWVKDFDAAAGSAERGVATLINGNSTSGYLYVLSVSVIQGQTAKTFLRKYALNGGAETALATLPAFEGRDMALVGSDVVVVGSDLASGTPAFAVRRIGGTPWVRAFPAPGNQRSLAYSVAVDLDGMLIVGGTAQVAASALDLWAKKLDPADGSEVLVWEKVVSPTGIDDIIHAVAAQPTGDGHIYFGGVRNQPTTAGSTGSFTVYGYPK